MFSDARGVASYLNAGGDPTPIVQRLSHSGRAALFAALAAPPNALHGSVRFLCPNTSVEILRLDPDGRIYLRGEQVPVSEIEGVNLVTGMLSWLATFGVRPGPGGHVTIQAGTGGVGARGGDVIFRATPQPIEPTALGPQNMESVPGPEGPPLIAVHQGEITAAPAPAEPPEPY